MTETITKEINGNSYEIAPFLGMTGWRYQLRLGKMIGPALKDAIGALPKGKIDDLLKADIDLSAMGGAIAAFVDAVAEGDKDGKFVAQLLSQTQRNGVALSESEINRAYAANYGEMMQALVAVVVANGFFGVGNIGLDRLSALTAESSPARSRKK
jgi:hypothetical protein